LHPESKKRKKEFKFEAYWMEDQECREIIKRIWNGNILNENSFSDKIQEVSKELATWSKDKFPNASIRIRELKRTLTKITNRTSGSFSKEEPQNIVNQLDKLWRQEEKYWGLRSHIN